MAAGGLGHRFAAEGGQLHGGFSVKNPGAFQRGVFAQRKPRSVGRDNSRLAKHFGHAGGKSHHAGLGVLGLVDDPVRIFKADGFQIESKALGSFLKHAAERAELFIQVSAHPCVLAALPGV